MQSLAARVQETAIYLGGGIIKVDAILNHQVDTGFMTRAGEAFVAAFEAHGVDGLTRVVTAETSGITPAFATAQVLGVPLLFARKRRPVTMVSTALVGAAPSRTGGGMVELMVSPEYLGQGDRVLIVDDFLGSGRTIAALADVVRQAGAQLLGIGCVIEKTYEQRDAAFAALDVPVVTLVKVALDGDRVVASA